MGMVQAPPRKKETPSTPRFPTYTSGSEQGRRTSTNEEAKGASREPKARGDTQPHVAKMQLTLFFSKNETT
jgi:hypothetical protein